MKNKLKVSSSLFIFFIIFVSKHNILAQYMQFLTEYQSVKQIDQDLAEQFLDKAAFQYSHTNYFGAREIGMLIREYVRIGSYSKAKALMNIRSFSTRDIEVIKAYYNKGLAQSLHSSKLRKYFVKSSINSNLELMKAYCRDSNFNEIFLILSRYHKKEEFSKSFMLYVYRNTESLDTIFKYSTLCNDGQDYLKYKLEERFINSSIDLDFFNKQISKYKLINLIDIERVMLKRALRSFENSNWDQFFISMSKIKNQLLLMDELSELFIGISRLKLNKTQLIDLREFICKLSSANVENSDKMYMCQYLEIISQNIDLGNALTLIKIRNNAKVPNFLGNLIVYILEHNDVSLAIQFADSVTAYSDQNIFSSSYFYEVIIDHLIDLDNDKLIHDVLNKIMDETDLKYTLESIIQRCINVRKFELADLLHKSYPNIYATTCEYENCKFVYYLENKNIGKVNDIINCLNRPDINYYYTCARYYLGFEFGGEIDD